VKPTAQICPILAAEGWRSGGHAPNVRTVTSTVADFIRPATAAGLIVARELSLTDREPLMLTETGRPILTAALRSRALGPRTDPY
jgi:hypothetical protein